MEKIVIQEQTKNCPGICYDQADKVLIIKGRSIPENPESVFVPLRNWINDFFKAADSLSISVVLEYINSGSSKHLLEILKLLREYLEKGKGIRIVWYYEEDDESIMELGEHFRDTSGLEIETEMLIDQDNI